MGDIIQKEVVVILLHYDYSYYLLQLRDFIPTIESPGQWGGFGGSVDKGETTVSAAYRELAEEISYTPESINKFRTYSTERLLSHLFYCELTVPFSKLILSEGADMGIFSKHDIFKGQLYSQKLKNLYPVAPLMIEYCKDFIDYVATTSISMNKARSTYVND